MDDKTAIRDELDLSRARWQRPTEAVQIAFVEHTDGLTYVAMRQNATTLVFTPSEWDAFVAGAKDGEFDEPW